MATNHTVHIGPSRIPETDRSLRPHLRDVGVVISKRSFVYRSYRDRFAGCRFLSTYEPVRGSGVRYTVTRGVGYPVEGKA